MSPDEVVVVPGGKPIIFFTLLALVEEGDEVIYPNPGFPIYESMIEFLGAKAVPIRLREEMEFRLDTRELKKPDQRAHQAHHSQLAAESYRRGADAGAMSRRSRRSLPGTMCMVLSDEIYSRLIFEGSHHSLFSYDDLRDRDHSAGRLQQDLRDDRMAHGIWRDARRPGATYRAAGDELELLHRQLHPEAGIEAIRGPQASVDAMNAEFRKRRDYFAERINRIKGFRCRVPKGAFYMFPNITGTGWKSKALADALLDEAGVAVLSGTAFGDYGEGYLRFSIANSWRILARRWIGLRPGLRSTLRVREIRHELRNLVHAPE